jgi:hypothetical protein
VPNVAILLQHECLPCAGEAEGLADNAKRKRPKRGQMGEAEGPKKKPKSVPRALPLLDRLQAIHVPKMQFQPVVDGSFIGTFMLHPGLCEDLNKNTEALFREASQKMAVTLY